MVPIGQEVPDYKDRSAAGSPTWAEDEVDSSSEESAPERRSSTVGLDQHGQRLDKVLVQLAPEFSRSHLQHLLQAGHVWVDGSEPRAASQKVRIGQRIELELVPTDESRAYLPQPMALAVLFEDEHLMVIDKPAGLVVHPAPGNWSGTLLNGLLAHHAAAGALPRAGIVHRLDKDTSGLMLVGKTLPAVTALTRAIAAREVHRRYMALAQGVPELSSFRVDLPIGRDPRVRVRMAVVPVAAGGRTARTDFVCQASRAGVSALLCTLFTGRTHQIRVHLSASGHPLVGDVAYGGRPDLGMQRHALHATELVLLHPITSAPLRFERAPPQDMAAAWAAVVGGP
jgi:23S rRNA pseudouridine1911/1915/1917 synthase